MSTDLPDPPVWPSDPLGERVPNWSVARQVKLYVWVMVSVSMLPIVYSLIEAGALSAEPYWVGLAVLTLFAGPFSLRVSSARASISASETFVLALAILFGPGPATLTVVLDALVGSLWNRDGSPYRTWFSVAERAIAVWLSAQLYYGLSDVEPLFQEPATMTQVGLPLLALTGSYFLLSGWFAGTAVWLDHYVSPFQILKERWTQLGLNFILSFLLLALLVLNAGNLGLAAGGLLVPLLVFAYVSSKLTQRRLERRTGTTDAGHSFQKLAENSQDVLWIKDAQTFEFTYVGPAYEEVWGRSRQHVQDPVSGWTSAIHRDDRAAVLAALRPESLSQGFQAEYRVVQPDGSIRWVKDRGFPVSAPTGVGRIVGIAEDVTDRRKLEQQLEGSQKLEGMGRLAGGVAHDFNNLLTAILGYSESIVSQSDPRDPLHEDAAEIQSAAEKAAALTRQLLAFSRRQALNMTVVDVNAVVRDVDRLLERLIGEHITVETRLEEAVEAVTADSTQLEQILINLAVNARDAMPDGGRVTIATAMADREDAPKGRFTIPAGRYTVLTVADTGTGMDAETQAQIFEPFFTTKEPGKGSGLGLATVYGTVKQLGGYIEVASVLGQGTTFTISLPSTDQAVTPTHRDEPQAEPGRGETILLVEDDDAVRGFTMQALRRSGYVVVEAAAPDIALRLAAEHQGRIDGVLTDVIMPVMNGRQMVTRLKTTRPDVKVLYMSGYSGTTYFDPSIVDPAQVRLLEKPFTRDVLLSALREVLEGEPETPTPAALARSA